MLFENDPKWIESMRIRARRFFHNHTTPRWLMFTMDSLAVYVTFLFAYLLRFNLVPSAFSIGLALQQGMVVLVVYGGFALLYRSYSGLIRHTTIRDVFNVFMSTTSALAVLFTVSVAGRNFMGAGVLIVPLSIILIHYVSIICFQLFVRMGIKMFFELITNSFGHKKRVLIFGAGSMGVIVMDVIERDKENRYRIMGFLDNNQRLSGKSINGIPVYNPRTLSREFLEKHRIETMIFAIKNIASSEKSAIIRNAVDLGLEVLEVPAVDNWLNGQLHLRQLKKVKLEALLGRDPIQLNKGRIRRGLEDKTILVTGAAGSIGSEIVRQLTRFPARRVLLVDQAETPMHHLKTRILKQFNTLPMEFIMADITHASKMQKIFQEWRPEIVFHAAAYKHVPLLEENPHEAFRVNIGGLLVISDLSVKYGVEKFVMVSSDKAVNPTNVMGATKRVCEMIVQSRSMKENVQTQFVITRFGNVLGSNGSVIPLFRKQIEEGGPVTVTHPEITRYFMTIPEACELVMEAGFMGKGGEIFVFDMGKPIKIVDLARQMIKLSGLEPEKDIRIEFTGLRPGEKLYEELLADRENTIPTHHPKIKIARVKEWDQPDMIQVLGDYLLNLYSFSPRGIVDVLDKLVPEYNSSNVTYNGHPEVKVSDIGSRGGDTVMATATGKLPDPPDHKEGRDPPDE